MTPLVSILIPAYNSEEWIAEALQSAIAQTWPKKEIIVVDDGSTDRTFDMARRFESREVKILRQPNQGAAGARNTAMSICQGDYIQCLDADDILEPNKVELQVRVGCDVGRRTLVSGAWAYFSYRKRKAKFEPTNLWADLLPVEWLTRKMS